MTRKQSFKLIRNLLIAIASVGWLVPLLACLDAFYHWLYYSTGPDYRYALEGDFDLRLSFCFFEVAVVWFGIVTAFWTFVAANKLWPIIREER